MNSAGNILKNNTLAAMQRQASPEVVSAIKKASASTGVDFAYLMEKASAESSFRTDVKARTSSATGLFQFIEKTWIAMVKEHGDKYGLGGYADKISANGKVSDPKARKEILELRKDPEAAAAMAAEYAAENKEYLESHVDGDIGPVELYFAHFMGPSGAAGFLTAMENNPLDTAADIFPAAARANRNVFYDAKTGEPRTLAGVYDFFAQKFQNSASDYDAPIMVASRDEEPRMAGKAHASMPVMKSESYDNDLLWAQELFQNNQARQLRLLAGANNDDENNDPSFVRSNERFTHLNARSGNPQAIVSNPVQVMQLAQLDTRVARTGYND